MMLSEMIGVAEKSENILMLGVWSVLSDFIFRGLSTKSDIFLLRVCFVGLLERGEARRQKADLGIPNEIQEAR